MNLILDQFRVPVRPLKEDTPVVLIWKVKGVKYRTKARTFSQGRIKALQIIGKDDRIVVGIFDTASQTMYGKVGLYAGLPYWFSKGEYTSLKRDGSLATDPYDF